MWPLLTLFVDGLRTYIRGKIGEDLWLRPGNTVAYLALEFWDRAHDAKLTVGACIEAGEGKGSSGDRMYFILAEALDPGLFLRDGRELTRRELKQLLKNRRGAQRSQIEALESELESIRQRLLELQPQSRMIESQVTMLRRVYELGKLRQRFDAPLDASDLRTLADESRSELRSLDLGGIAALQEEVDRL